MVITGRLTKTLYVSGNHDYHVYEFRHRERSKGRSKASYKGYDAPMVGDDEYCLEGYWYRCKTHGKRFVINSYHSATEYRQRRADQVARLRDFIGHRKKNGTNGST